MESTTTWMRLGGMAASGLMLVLSAEHYGQSLGPLRQRETETVREFEDLRERVEDGKKTIAATRALEKEADRIRGEIARRRRDILAGAEKASFPTLVKAHFARVGVVVSSVALTAAQDEPNVSGCERAFWSVDLPIDEGGRNVATLLAAVADLDQQNPFVRVLDFAIRTDAENPGARAGLMNVAVVIRK